MNLDDFRGRLYGPDPLLMVEAAAGAGKTHEAVAAAHAMGSQLGPGRSALLLTHTNAAGDEFVERFGHERAAHVQTLDSLACELVDRYALHFRLPRPLRPDATHAGHPSFSAIRAMACELLRDAPAVARGLAARHPVILVDEHQDSSGHQHEMVWRIAQSGDVRLRLFGDRLQAIYDWGGQTGPWSELVDEHGALPLREPRRWPHAPELGEWLGELRVALSHGEPIGLPMDIPRVDVLAWDGAGPGPKQAGSCPDALRDVLGPAVSAGNAAVLVRSNRHGWGLAVRFGKSMGLKLHEGLDVRAPTRWLEAAIEADGNPVALVAALAALMEEAGTGLDARRRADLQAVCTPAGVHLGRRTRIRPLAERCEPIFAEPTLACWLDVLRRCLTDHKLLDWRPVRRGPLMLLYALRIELDADPLNALTQLARGRRRLATAPRRAVMTIHRAKGRQFDTVVIPYLGESSFDASADAARHLYVAASRAQRRLVLLVPSDEPSPLLSWPSWPN